MIIILYDTYQEFAYDNIFIKQHDHCKFSIIIVDDTGLVRNSKHHLCRNAKNVGDRCK